MGHASQGHFHCPTRPRNLYAAAPVNSFSPARSILCIGCVLGSVPSIDKGRHGFDGQKCAHTASSPLTIRQVFSAGLFLSGHISAPAKLPAPGSDVFSSDFCFLRRRLAESAYSRRCCRATFLWSEADARQDEKDKKRRKDTLSGVFALVNRWYRVRFIHLYAALYTPLVYVYTRYMNVRAAERTIAQTGVEFCGKCAILFRTID